MTPADPIAVPLCESCGYDLRATAPGTKCPECGNVPRPNPGLPAQAIFGTRALIFVLPVLMAVQALAARTVVNPVDVAAKGLHDVVEACLIASSLVAAAGLGFLSTTLPTRAKAARWTAFVVIAMLAIAIALLLRTESGRFLPFERIVTIQWGLRAPVTVISCAWWLSRLVEAAFAATILNVCARWAHEITRFRAAGFLQTAAFTCAAVIASISTVAIAFAQIRTPRPLQQQIPGQALPPFTPPAIDTILGWAANLYAPILILSLMFAWLAVAWLWAAGTSPERARHNRE